MSDYKSTVRQIAQEKGCSVATVNNKAKAAGIKIKDRSPEDHTRLLDALKDVKARKKIGVPVAAKREAKKSRRSPRKNPARAEDTSLDLNSFFNQGKVYIAEIRRRLVALDKEKGQLEEQLEKLFSLYPEMKK